MIGEAILSAIIIVDIADGRRGPRGGRISRARSQILCTQYSDHDNTHNDKLFAIKELDKSGVAKEE